MRIRDGCRAPFAEVNVAVQLEPVDAGLHVDVERARRAERPAVRLDVPAFACEWVGTGFSEFDVFGQMVLEPSTSPVGRRAHLDATAAALANLEPLTTNPREVWPANQFNAPNSAVLALAFASADWRMDEAA